MTVTRWCHRPETEQKAEAGPTGTSVTSPGRAPLKARPLQFWPMPGRPRHCWGQATRSGADRGAARQDRAGAAGGPPQGPQSGAQRPFSQAVILTCGALQRLRPSPGASPVPRSLLCLQPNPPPHTSSPEQKQHEGGGPGHSPLSLGRRALDHSGAPSLPRAPGPRRRPTVSWHSASGTWAVQTESVEQTPQILTPQRCSAPASAHWPEKQGRCPEGPVTHMEGLRH